MKPRSISSRPAWAVYAVIFAVAWALRFIVLWQFTDMPFFQLPLVDASEYHQLAVSLAGGRILLPKLAWQPWFFPLALSQLYEVAGPSLWAARLMQITVGSLTCMTTAALGHALWPRKAMRWTAGLIAALYGPMVLLDGRLLAEPWAGLWITAAALLALKYRSHPSPNLALGLGILGSLILFTRPPLLAGWLPLILVASVAGKGAYGDRPLQRALFHAGLLAIGFAATAWPLVNAIKTSTGHARFLPVTGGLNFYIGNSEDPCRTINIRPGPAWETLTLWPTLHGAQSIDEKDAFYRWQALAAIRADPGGAAVNFFDKACQFISSREIPRNLDFYVLAEEAPLLQPLLWRIGGFGFPFGLLIGLAAVGAWRKRFISLGLLVSIAGYAAAIILVHVCARYRMPVIPLFIVLGAAGVLALTDALRERQWKQLGSFAGIVVLLGLLTSIGGPFCSETLNYRSELQRLIGTTAAEQDMPELAQASFLKAVKENPQNAAAWSELGVLNATRGQLKSAERNFLEAVACDPSTFPAWFNLGKIAAGRREYDTAVTYYQTGLKHSPGYLPAWIDLGDLHLKQTNMAEATRCYQETLRIQPGFPAGRQRLKQVQRMLGGENSGLIKKAGNTGKQK